MAIVGANASSLSEAIAGIADTRGVVQVSNVSTADDLTWDPATGRDRPYVFRVCTSDVVMGGSWPTSPATTSMRAASPSSTRWAARTAPSSPAASPTPSSIPAGGRVAAEFFYLPLETDFRNQLREVAAFRADVLFLPGSFTDATLIAGQAERLGIRPTLLGGDAWSNRLLFKRGGPTRTAYHSDHCAPAGRVPRALPARVRRGVRRVPGHPGLRRGAGGGGRPARAAGSFGRRPDRGPCPAPATARATRWPPYRFEGVAGTDPLRRARRRAPRRRDDGGRARAVRAPAATSTAGWERTDVPGRALRDLTLNWKVGLTLTVAFAAIAVLFLLVLIPFQREQRQRILDRDQRLLSILREKYQRDLIYDVLSENAESLAVDLADLAAQPGIVWVRLQRPRPPPGRHRRPGPDGPPAGPGGARAPRRAPRPAAPAGRRHRAGPGRAAHRRRAADRRRPPRAVRRLPAAPASGFGEAVWQGEGVLHHHAELRAGDQSFGRLDILYSLAELRRAEILTRRLFYGLVGTTFVLLLLLLNLLLSRIVIRPVQALSEAMSDASKGRLDRRLPVNSRDEIGTMALAFNVMAADLEASKREIEDYSRNLEIKVAERTRLLRESEEQLRALKNHLETVLAHVATGVVSLDDAGRIETFNDRAAEILSVSAPEALGRELREILGEGGDALVALVTDVRSGGEELRKAQLVLNLPQGRRTLSVVASALPGAAGRRAGTVVVFDDITQLLATQRLQAWKEAVDRVIHEIKNPLTPVGLAAQTLRTAYTQDRGRFDAIFPSAIEMILKAVRDLKSLITDFTRFYRLPAAVMQRGDVNALVADALSLYQQSGLGRHHHRAGAGPRPARGRRGLRADPPRAAERHRQRDRRHGGAARPADRAHRRRPGRLRLDLGVRRGRGHRGRGADLRALLHDQGQGHGAGADHLPPDRGGPPRADPRHQQGGGRHHGRDPARPPLADQRALSARALSPGQPMSSALITARSRR